MGVENHSFFSMGPQTPLAIPYGAYDLITDAGRAASRSTTTPRVRRRVDVGSTRPCRRSGRASAADHRGRGWHEQLPLWVVEGGTGDAGRGDWPCDHRLPFASGTSKRDETEHRLFSHVMRRSPGRDCSSGERIQTTMTPHPSGHELSRLVTPWQ